MDPTRTATANVTATRPETKLAFLRRISLIANCQLLISLPSRSGIQSGPGATRRPPRSREQRQHDPLLAIACTGPPTVRDQPRAAARWFPPSSPEENHSAQ